MDDQKQATNPNQSSNSILQGSIDLTSSPTPQASLPNPDGEDFLPEHASSPATGPQTQPTSILFEQDMVPPTFIDQPSPPQNMDSTPPESILNPHTTTEPAYQPEETTPEPITTSESDNFPSATIPESSGATTLPPQLEAPNQPASDSHSVSAVPQPPTHTPETTPPEPPASPSPETITPPSSPTPPPQAKNHLLLVILVMLVGLIIVIAAVFAFQSMSGDNSPSSQDPDSEAPQDLRQSPTTSPTQAWTIFEGETAYTQDGTSQFSIKYPPHWEREGNVLYPYGTTASTRIALGSAGRGTPVAPTDKSFPAGTARYYWDAAGQNDFGFASFSLNDIAYIFEVQNIPASTSAELKEQFDLMLTTFRPITTADHTSTPAATNSGIPKDWVKHTLKSQGLSLYFPKGWQANAINNLDTNRATVNFYQSSPQTSPITLVIQSNWDNTQNAQSSPINYQVGKDQLSAIKLTNVKAATDSSQLVNRVYFEHKEKVHIFSCSPEINALCDQVLQTLEF